MSDHDDAPVDEGRALARTVGVALAALQWTSLAALGGLVAGVASGRRDLAVVGTAVAGAVSAPYAAAVARHRPYSLDALGAARWLVDSTWSAPNTLAGALFFAHQRARGNRVRPARTRGSGTVDLARQAIPGFATTVGTVVAGSRERIDAHERVHVSQERVLGPFYGPLVALDYLRLIALPTWWRRHDHESSPITGPRTYLQRGVYPRVWHERWAYGVAPAGSAPLTLAATVAPLVRRRTRDARQPAGRAAGWWEWAQQDSNL